MKLFGNEHHGGSHTGDHRIAVTEIRSDAPETAPEAEPEQSGAPETPNKQPKKPRRWPYIVGAVVLALVVAVIGYSLWERPPEITIPTAAPAGTESADPSASEKPGGLPDDPDATPAVTEQPAETTDPGEAPSVQFASERRDGIYTVLIVGRDVASGSTDTILIGGFDTVNHKITCVSIPRDTLINIAWSTTPKKINAVFPGYENMGKSGIDALREQVKNLLGFDVDCYAVVTIQAMEEAVDAIGGVWFDVPQDMHYYDPAQDLQIHLNAGYQLLNGEQALKLCRFRYGYAGGDIQRIGVQQSFLKALASQMLTLGNIPNLGTLIDILVKNVDTNLTAANLAWFARQFLSCRMDDVSFQTMPIGSSNTINGISFVSIGIDKWLALVNSSINPYLDEVTRSNVNILTSAGGGSFYSTNGQLAGGPDSFYCLECTVKTGKAVHHAPGMHIAAESEAPSGSDAPAPPDVPGPTDAPTPTEAPPAPTEAPPAETPQVEVVTPPAEGGEG